MPNCESKVRNNWERVVQDADEQGDVLFPDGDVCGMHWAVEVQDTFAQYKDGYLGGSFRIAHPPLPKDKTYRVSLEGTLNGEDFGFLAWEVEPPFGDLVLDPLVEKVPLQDGENTVCAKVSIVQPLDPSGTDNFSLADGVSSP